MLISGEKLVKWRNSKIIITNKWQRKMGFGEIAISTDESRRGFGNESPRLS